MELMPLPGKYNWMRVVDVMTRTPCTVAPTEPIRRALELMSARGIRHIPVVDGKSLVGIISDRDIRTSLGRLGAVDFKGSPKTLNFPVCDAMTRDPATVAPDDDLLRAVQLLIEEKIGGLPVVKNDSELLGIVTYSDLLSCFLNRLREN